MVDHRPLPQWFDDHLHCAPPRAWLPALLAGGQARTIGALPPRALRKLVDGRAPLGSDDTELDVLVHTGELWRPLALEPADVARLRAGAVVIDLAWVDVWSGALRLQAWRRAPGQRAAADRLAALLELGLRAPQQWVSADRTAVVITLAVAAN
jgi:hypothetical protein